MITIAEDCLLFQTRDGETVPYSADMISVEIGGQPVPEWVDPEFLRQAAKAVFHYFRHEEQRQTVTMGEFAGALEKVIFGLKLVPESPTAETVVAEADLGRIACASGAAFELMFFPLLRAELKEKLSLSPRVLRFRGLRKCVKRLARAQRWSRRCQELQHQIVRYLRGCLSTERCADGFSLVVE